MAGYLSKLFGLGPRLVESARRTSHAVPGPETPADDAVAMQPKWRVISDVLEGHDAIKAAGRKYLPQFAEEDSENYKRRLADAPWFPIFNAAVDGLTSRPFSRDVTLNGRPSPKMQAIKDDVDMRGNNLTVFAKRTFEEAVTFGLAGILVDYTRATPRLDGKPLTLADEKEQGLRPYWVHIRPQDIIDYRTDYIKGREVCVHLRVFECATVNEGFTSKAVSRVRLIELDETGRPHWKLYEQQGTEGYVEIASGDLTIPEIPFVPYFTGRRFGSFGVTPPLYNLARMAITYYQALARKTEIETYAGWPMLVVRGAPATPSTEDTTRITVGPSKSFVFETPEGDAKIIGPDASLVAEIAKGPDRVKDEFQRLAMEPTIPRTGNVTATASAIDNSRAHSAIEAWAIGLQDALNQAFRFTAMWLNEADQTTCNVATDFVSIEGSVEEARVLSDAQKRGVISKKTERIELKRRGILSSDFDEIAEDEQIAFETEGLEPEELIIPSTGLPVLREEAA